jgi:hypothetical protein
MDLTTTYPTSVKTKLHGIVQIARTIDKGKAKAHGNLGDYHYNCPMDQAVFTLLGIDHEALLDVISKATSDQEISDYVAPFIHKKSDAEIEAWNASWLKQAPAPGSDGAKYFFELRNEVAPDRTDVTAWADLLDLDEKRAVPKVAATV